jgi:hypothetical protein
MENKKVLGLQGFRLEVPAKKSNRPRLRGSAAAD